MTKKRKFLLGSAAVALCAVVATSGIFVAPKGEASVPSAIPAEAQPIVYKMMDAIDNYKFVNAVVRVEREGQPSSTTTLAIKLDPKVKVKSETVFDNGKVIKQFQNKGKLLAIDETNKSYSEHKVAEEVERGWKKKMERRFQQFGNGEVHFAPRMNPIMVSTNGADAALYPQDLALGVLHRATDVKVTGQETLLNRAATIVEGNPMEGHHSSFGDHLKLWIDDETGILLKGEYSKNGQVFASQTVTDLELNKPISDDKFGFPSVEGYKN